MTTASAWVPGHVTGLFSAHPADDPREAGSRGAGLALSHGVEVRVRPAEETRIVLEGREVEMAAVTGVLDRLDETVEIVAETPLPISAGFGVSGATTLGTALATNAALDLGHSENELVTLAHAAEVEAGTGLGDVVAQARGGMPIRLEPGAPPTGALDGIPARPRVEYVSFGGLSTAEVITGDTEQLSVAGEQALEELLESPDVERFMRAARTFARDAGLLTDRVAEAIEDVTEAGGEASMAMLGETVFALGTGLSDAGYDATACEVAGGAALQTGHF